MRRETFRGLRFCLFQRVVVAVEADCWKSVAAAFCKRRERQKSVFIILFPLLFELSMWNKQHESVAIFIMIVQLYFH